MITFTDAAILGIVEGLTEFLPISSTFHLIWVANLLSLPQSDFLKLFQVAIQSGAILAVTTLYLRTAFKEPGLVKNIILSFLPTAVFGSLLYSTIKDTFFESFIMQLLIFIGVGVFFIFFEKKNRSNGFSKKAGGLSTREALLVGFAQSLAVFPGVSRAGAVIVFLMCLRVSRVEAAKYSFLLAVPTLLGATAFDLLKSKDVLFQNESYIPLLAVGFLFSFLSAVIVVKWFIGFLQKNTLTSFGWYRIVAGILLFFLLGLLTD